MISTRVPVLIGEGIPLCWRGAVLIALHHGSRCDAHLHRRAGAERIRNCRGAAEWASQGKIRRAKEGFEKIAVETKTRASIAFQ